MRLAEPIFYAPQGEGKYSGTPTIWVRFFGCNLRCQGFSDYQGGLSVDSISTDGIKVLEENILPTIGCDSAYAWHPKYKKFAIDKSEKEIIQDIDNIMSDVVIGRNSKIHLAFTGGEPMLQQDKITDLVYLVNKKYPEIFNVTIETNGTIPLEPEFLNGVGLLQNHGIQFLFSISPKLQTVSGEEDAINPKLLNEYVDSVITQLKFVVGNKQEQKTELIKVLSALNIAGEPIYIMPSATTKEQHNSIVGDITEFCLKHGFILSIREHLLISDKQIGA